MTASSKVGLILAERCIRAGISCAEWVNCTETSCESTDAFHEAVRSTGFSLCEPDQVRFRYTKPHHKVLGPAPRPIEWRGRWHRRGLQDKPCSHCVGGERFTLWGEIEAASSWTVRNYIRSGICFWWKPNFLVIFFKPRSDENPKDFEDHLKHFLRGYGSRFTACMKTVHDTYFNEDKRHNEYFHSKWFLFHEMRFYQLYHLSTIRQFLI